MKRVVWYFNESLVLLFCTIQGETQSELALTKQSVLIVVDNITSVFAEKLQQPETFLEIVPAVIAYVKLHKTCPLTIEVLGRIYSVSIYIKHVRFILKFTGVCHIPVLPFKLQLCYA